MLLNSLVVLLQFLCVGALAWGAWLCLTLRDKPAKTPVDRAPVQAAREESAPPSQLGLG